jgi:hypothetical protein
MRIAVTVPSGWSVRLTNQADAATAGIRIDSLSDARPTFGRHAHDLCHEILVIRLRRPESPDRDRGGSQAVTCWRKRTIEANSAGSMLAPPTRAPSMSGWDMIAATLAAFTDPP